MFGYPNGMLDNLTGVSMLFLMEVAGVVLLGIALAYASVQYRRRSRNPTVKRVSENATRRMYDVPER